MAPKKLGKTQSWKIKFIQICFHWKANIIHIKITTILFIKIQISCFCKKNLKNQVLKLCFSLKFSSIQIDSTQVRFFFCFARAWEQTQDLFGFISYILSHCTVELKRLRRWANWLFNFLTSLFVTISHFRLILKYACKAGAHLNGVLPHSQGKILTFPVSIRLGSEWKTVTNTLSNYNT